MLLMQLLVTLLVAAAVFALVWSLFRYPVAAEPPVHRRMAMEMGAATRQTVFEQPLLAPLLSLTLGIAQRFNLPSIRNKIRQDLDASGNPNGYSVEEYLAICLLSGGLLGFAAMTVELMTMSRFMVITVPAVAALGFFLPIYLLGDAAGTRVARIAKQLPYTLDLIALSMAAGSTFSEAIDTIIRDDPNDDFNQELAIVQAEIRFGASRANALGNLANRIPLETLRSVVGAVNQAESLGTPLSQILKTQSTMLRVNRTVRAEKLSASASLRILIPSMLIMFAVVMSVLAPFIIRRIQGGSWW